MRATACAGFPVVSILFLWVSLLLFAVVFRGGLRGRGSAMCGDVMSSSILSICVNSRQNVHCLVAEISRFPLQKSLFQG